MCEVCVCVFLLFFLLSVLVDESFVASFSSLGSHFISGFLSSPVSPVDASIGSALHDSASGSSFLIYTTNRGTAFTKSVRRNTSHKTFTNI